MAENNKGIKVITSKLLWEIKVFGCGIKKGLIVYSVRLLEMLLASNYD